MLQRSPNFVASARDTYRYVEQTPLEFEAQQLPSGQLLSLKHETEQRAGSFKVRGMVSAALSHDTDHLVLASAGGAGAGLAYAVHELGKQARIYVPETAPERKKQLIRDLGGRAVKLVEVAGDFPATQQVAQREATAQGIVYQSPYNDPAVVSGHRQVTEEILAQNPDNRSNVIFVPVGGGSLLAGALEATAQTGDKVVGVQFATNRSAELSLSAGQHVAATELDSRAEGSAAQVGAYTLEIMKRHQERLDFVTVSAAEVGGAIDREIGYRYQTYEAPYPGMGELAPYRFPETTGFVAEAGAWKYAEHHPQTNDEHWIAIRSGSNTDELREQALLDAYRQLAPSSRLTSRVWNGAHTNYR